MKTQQIRSSIWLQEGSQDDLLYLMQGYNWFKVGTDKEKYYLLNLTRPNIILCEVTKGSNGEHYRYTTVPLGFFAAILRHRRIALRANTAEIAIEALWEKLSIDSWMRTQYLMEIEVHTTNVPLEILNLMGEEWQVPTESTPSQ